jgi:hypothetical protein
LKVAGAGSVLLLMSSASATTPTGFTASLRCHAEASYVLCFVPVDVDARSRITYAQASVLKAPPFLQQVGGMATFSDSTQSLPKLKLGFVARGAGSGTILVEAKAIVCQDNPFCPQVSQLVSATVNVPKK